MFANKGHAFAFRMDWYDDGPAPTDPFRSADKASRDKESEKRERHGKANRRCQIVGTTLNFWIFKIQTKKGVWRTSKPTSQQASLCIQEAIADRGSLPLPEHQTSDVSSVMSVRGSITGFPLVQSRPRILMAKARTKSEPSACI